MSKLKFLLPMILVACLASAAHGQGQTLCPTNTWPYPNDPVTGTTQYTLTKINSSGNAVIMATTDTAGFAGIAIYGAGQSGSVCLARIGLWPLKMSNTATAQHYVQISSGTGGDGADTGATTYPTSGGDVIGRVQAYVSGAGLAIVDLGPEVQAVGLPNVTNDAQTKAAIVPNTTPSAGQLLVGNAGGTAYAPVTMSGDCTITSAGAMACVPHVADTTITIGTTAISGNSKTTVATVTMTGATTSMVVSISPSADYSGTTGWGTTGGLVIMAWVSSANTVSYYVINQTASSITPGASTTWNVSVR